MHSQVFIADGKYVSLVLGREGMGLKREAEFRTRRNFIDSEFKAQGKILQEHRFFHHTPFPQQKTRYPLWVLSSFQV